MVTANTVFQNQVMGLHLHDSIPAPISPKSPCRDADLAWYSTPLGTRRQPVHSSLIDSQIPAAMMTSRALWPRGGAEPGEQ
jgi:hypothetical protein